MSVEIGGRRFRIGRQLLEDANAQNLTDVIRELRRALLVFHAPGDEIVPVENALRIFEAATHPKNFVSLDGADHLLTRGSDALYVAQVLAAWVGRYLDAPAQPEPVRREGTVVVHDSPRGKLTQEINAGGHHFVADEPAGMGDDLGPTPYDLLLAALGACTAMTLQLYADRKNWPLAHVSVELRHDRIHAHDSLDCDTPPCRIERIDRILRLDGPLNDEQRHRLIEIAERCPVHRTLMGEKRIVTRLEDVELTVSEPDPTAVGHDKIPMLSGQQAN
jgi:putative redox protein